MTSGPWKCFHCGFVAHNEVQARGHFGEPFSVAECQLERVMLRESHDNWVEIASKRAKRIRELEDMHDAQQAEIQELNRLLTNQAHRIGNLQVELEAIQLRAADWQRVANDRAREIFRLDDENALLKLEIAALVAKEQDRIASSLGLKPKADL